MFDVHLGEVEAGKGFINAGFFSAKNPMIIFLATWHWLMVHLLTVLCWICGDYHFVKSSYLYDLYMLFDEQNFFQSVDCNLIIQLKLISDHGCREVSLVELLYARIISYDNCNFRYEKYKLYLVQIKFPLFSL